MNTATMRMRVTIAAVLGFAAVAAPVLGTFSTPQAAASPNCLAWVGSRDDGQCIGYSNGSPTYIGTPNFGVYGPGGGLGITSGPLLPGTTITQGIGD